MKIILFTNARDETHIKEWVAHHLNLGFDHIFIFDHKSVIPIQSQFKPNINLTIRKIDGTGNIKGPCMENAINYAKNKQYDWMMYLDADEFLVLNSYKSIQDIINANPTCNQICFNWIMFGSNHLTNDPEGMILENYIRCSSKINQHVKSIVKVSAVSGVYNAHIFRTNDITNSINCYNSTKVKHHEPWFFRIEDKDYTELPAYIAHYIYQSYSIYKKRRTARQRDDGTVYRVSYTEEELHQLENDIINISVRDLYCENNKITMDEL